MLVHKDLLLLASHLLETQVVIFTVALQQILPHHVLTLLTHTEVRAEHLGRVLVRSAGLGLGKIPFHQVVQQEFLHWVVKPKGAGQGFVGDLRNRADGRNWVLGANSKEHRNDDRDILHKADSFPKLLKQRLVYDSSLSVLHFWP